MTPQKIALLQKIINAKLTKEELQQVIAKAESLKNKPKNQTVNRF
jgi:hypothetical protein